MKIQQTAFLSCHWKGNNELRTWFKKIIQSVGLYVIEANDSETEPVNKVIEKKISDSDIYIGLLTLDDDLSWIKEELGFAHGKSKPLIVFCEFSDKDRISPKGFEQYRTISCAFDRTKLVESTPDIIRYLHNAMETNDHERIAEQLGFRIIEHEVSTRFSKWDEITHEEIFCKKFKILPLRENDIIIDVISGSTRHNKKKGDSNKINSINYFSHSHPGSVIEDMCDGFHYKCRTSINNVTRGKPFLLWEKTIREDVPNEAKDCVHPKLAEYSNKNYYTLTCHVLYPTELLKVNVEFSKNKRIDSEYMPKTIQHKFGRQLPLKSVDISLSPTREFLGLEIANAEPNTDYLLIWRWE